MALFLPTDFSTLEPGNHLANTLSLLDDQIVFNRMESNCPCLQSAICNTNVCDDIVFFGDN